MIQTVTRLLLTFSYKVKADWFLCLYQMIQTVTCTFTQFLLQGDSRLVSLSLSNDTDCDPTSTHLLLQGDSRLVFLSLSNDIDCTFTHLLLQGESRLVSLSLSNDIDFYSPSPTRRQ